MKIDYEDINLKVDFRDLGDVWNQIITRYGKEGVRIASGREKAKILPEDLFEWDEE